MSEVQPDIQIGLSSLRSRCVQWTKLIAVTGFAQILIQAIGFVCGILVIRLLPTQEYALYTLANTMLGTMTLLADGGIASGVMSQGGKVWTDRKRLGEVLSTGMALRQKFAIVSLVFTIPITFWLLHKHSASWLASALLIASILPAFFSAVTGKLLEIPPKLHQDIGVLQKIRVGSNAARLCLTTIFLFAFPFASIAICSTGVATIYENIRLRNISKTHADPSQPVDEELTSELLGVVKKTLPGAIYYCISGQVTIFMISIFGSSNALAQIGALSRLVVVLSVFRAVFDILVVARFARISKGIVLSRFLQVQVLLFTVGLSVIGLVALFPHRLLWILGESYSNLTNEVLLMVIGSVLALFSGSVYSLCTARAIIPRPRYLIPILITIQVIAALSLDLSSIHGALLFQIATFAAAYLLRLVHGIWSICNAK